MQRYKYNHKTIQLNSPLLTYSNLFAYFNTF